MFGTHHWIGRELITFMYRGKQRMSVNEFLLNPGLILMFRTMCVWGGCRLFHLLLFQNVRRHRRLGILISNWVSALFFLWSLFGKGYVGYHANPGVEVGIAFGIIFGWIHFIFAQEACRGRLVDKKRRIREGRFGIQGKKVY